MSDEKAISFSDKAAVHEVTEEGTVLSEQKVGTFRRFLNYIRLDNGDDTSAAGRWTNEG